MVSKAHLNFTHQVLTLFSTTLHFTLSTPAIPPLLLFLRLIQQAPSSGPLFLLFPLPGMHFPQHTCMVHHSLTSSSSLVKITEARPSLHTYLKYSHHPVHTLSHPPPPVNFFSLVLIPSLYLFHSLILFKDFNVLFTAVSSDLK